MSTADRTADSRLADGTAEKSHCCENNNNCCVEQQQQQQQI